MARVESSFWFLTPNFVLFREQSLQHHRNTRFRKVKQSKNWGRREEPKQSKAKQTNRTNQPTKQETKKLEIYWRWIVLCWREVLSLCFLSLSLLCPLLLIHYSKPPHLSVWIFPWQKAVNNCIFSRALRWR